MVAVRAVWFSLCAGGEGDLLVAGEKRTIHRSNYRKKLFLCKSYFLLTEQPSVVRPLDTVFGKVSGSDPMVHCTTDGFSKHWDLDDWC